MKIKLTLASALLWLLATALPAAAQSACATIATGAVLTAAQWQACFQSKADVTAGGYLPISGGTMTGELITAASQAAIAGFNLPPGAAPTTPNNGDLWTTSSGMFTQIAGVSVQWAGQNVTNTFTLLQTFDGGITFNGTGAGQATISFNGGTSPIITSASGTPINIKSTTSIIVTADSDNDGSGLFQVVKGTSVGLTVGSASVGDAGVTVGSPGGGSQGTGTINTQSTIYQNGIAVATLSDTQTLTNKTIAASTDVLGGVTMTLGSDAEGDIYYRHSGVLTRLPIGSTSNVLTVSGGIPTWQAGSSAGSVTVGTTTINSGLNTGVMWDNSGVLATSFISAFLSGGTGISITGTSTATIAVNLTSGTGITVSGATINTNLSAGTGISITGSAPQTIALSTPVSVSNGGTGLTSITAHAVLLGAATSNIAGTGPGTAGQCLVANGASADPSFQSGCDVLLNTLTASSSANLQDTTSLTSTYQNYTLVFKNIICATASQPLELLIHSNGAFPVTSYLTAINGSITANPTTYIPLTDAETLSQGGFVGELHIANPSQTSSPKPVYGNGFFIGAGATRTIMTGGVWTGGNTAVDGFQLQCGSGNITSGAIEVYGRL